MDNFHRCFGMKVIHTEGNIMSPVQDESQPELIINVVFVDELLQRPIVSVFCHYSEARIMAHYSIKLDYVSVAAAAQYFRLF